MKLLVFPLRETQTDTNQLQVSTNESSGESNELEEKFEITDGEDTDIFDGKSINSIQLGSDTRIF